MPATNDDVVNEVRKLCEKVDEYNNRLKSYMTKDDFMQCIRQHRDRIVVVLLPSDEWPPIDINAKDIINIKLS